MSHGSTRSLNQPLRSSPLRQRSTGLLSSSPARAGCPTCPILERRLSKLKEQIESEELAAWERKQREERDRDKTELARREKERQLRAKMEREIQAQMARLREDYEERERRWKEMAAKERREWLLMEERKQKRNETLSRQAWMIVRKSDRQWAIAQNFIIRWNQKVL